MKRHTAFAMFSGAALALTLGVGCDDMGSSESAGPGDSGTVTPPSEYGQEPPAVAQESTVTGVLRSQAPQQGDEHTGWVLAGTAEGEIEVDVSAVADQAAALEGTQVKVTGEMTEVEYDSRGLTLVLIVESIQPIG
jgi:hypothetical protein